VNQFKILDVPNTDFSDKEDVVYLNKYAKEFIKDYEDNVNETLTQITTFSDNIRKIIVEMNRYSDQLDIPDYDFSCDSTPKKHYSPKKFDYKECNISPPFSPDPSEIAFERKSKVSPFINTEVSEYTPKTQLDLSKDDQLNLFQNLQNKEKEIEYLKEKLSKSEKAAKKTRKRTGKKKANTKEKRENFYKETMEELDKLNQDEDDSPFELCPQASASKLAEMETHTIKEADERYEEDTQFDKEGNRLNRSNKSLESSGQKEKMIAQEIKYNSLESQKYDINQISKDPHFSKTHEISLSKIMNDQIFSEESESVKVEEDLLNDSIKFDENIF